MSAELLKFEGKRLNSDRTREALDGLVAATKAAHVNEGITRQRVDYIEAILGRTFIGRLKWLLLGR